MAKKKDCFGSETYVCRTQNCPYVSDCVQIVWEKKLKRILARRRSGVTTLESSMSVRVRSKEFLAR